MKSKIVAFLLVAALAVSFTGCVSAVDGSNGLPSAVSSVTDGESSMSENNIDSGADKITEQGSNVSSESESTGSSAESSSASKPSDSSNENSSASSKPSSSQTGNSSSKPSNSSVNENSSLSDSNSSYINNSNSSKPNHSGSIGNNSSSSKPSSGSHTATPKPTPKPIPKPAAHTHKFVDMGVQSLDWTYGAQDNTGPTNTYEQVSGVNACLGCGYFLGNDSDKFAERYYDHIWGPDASSCGGAYTYANVYAHYHLLECSDPDCLNYKRGNLA